VTANKQKQTESSRNKRHGDQMFGQNWKLDEIGQSKVRSGSFWFVLVRSDAAPPHGSLELRSQESARVALSRHVPVGVNVAKHCKQRSVG
jgi:hypothetical protein